MAKEIGSSLKDVITSFNNVLGKLIRNHPLFFIVFILIISAGLYFFTQSESRMTFGLSILISFVSIVIFTKTKNYGETLLSFMLGVLTIFTIEWDTYSSLLFIGFYIAVNTIIFFIQSIQIAIKFESELTSAATYIDLKNFKSTYKRIETICKEDTRFNAFGEIEKAETIKYLAYMKVPISEIKNSIENIELIKVVYQIDLKDSCDFFKSLYFIQKRSHEKFSITLMLDKISNKRLPLMPTEFLEILQKTKKELITGKFTLEKYLDIIDQSVTNGEDLTEIIELIKE